MNKSNIAFLEELEAVVRNRLAESSDASYTAKLAKEGTRRIAQKVGEEGVELALAAVAQNKEEIVDEAADLFYHVIVLLAEQGLGLKDVSERLQTRHAVQLGLNRDP